MKLHEIIDPKNELVFYVRTEADIPKAVTFAMGREMLSVDIEAHAGISTEQIDADHIAISAIVRKVLKHKPGKLGSTLIHFNIYGLKDLRKILEALTEYFRPAPWRWAVSIDAEVYHG